MAKKKPYSTNIFFTSDTHFRHDNALIYCNRPWTDIMVMEQDMINNWNKKVPPDAHIFHLGDFGFTGNISTIRGIVEALNGSIHLIMGNHDYQNKFDRPSVREVFASTHDYLYIDVDDPELEEKQGLFLCHYPMLSWNQSQKGSWQLHGHIHSGPRSNSKDNKLVTNKTQYDVGVDNNEFIPISYEEVKIKITKQHF